MKKNLVYLIILLIMGTGTYISFRHFTATPKHLYKIVSLEDWNQSAPQPHLVLSPMDKNFIHLSTKKQLDGIIKKFWSTVAKFVVLTVDSSKLPGRLVFEANPGGSNKYYHLYEGSIPQESILKAQSIEQHGLEHYQECPQDHTPNEITKKALEHTKTRNGLEKAETIDYLFEKLDQ